MKLPFILASLTILLPWTSQATPLLQGNSVSLSGVTHASNPEFSGSVIANKTIPFEIRDSLNNIIVTGDYQSQVIRNSAGKLVFTGQIKNTANPPFTFGWITDARMEGFGFVNTDVETKDGATGNVLATEATRSTSGDLIQFAIGPRFLNPPNESKPFMVLTSTENFVESGTVTLFGSDDFGGTPFSVTLKDVYVPVKPPLHIELGERFFFETQFFYPIDVTGAAEGVVLQVQSSSNLEPMSWINQENRAADSRTTRTFGTVTPTFNGREFYRIQCVLPGS